MQRTDHFFHWKSRFDFFSHRQCWKRTVSMFLFRCSSSCWLRWAEKGDNFSPSLSFDNSFRFKCFPTTKAKVEIEIDLSFKRSFKWFVDRLCLVTERKRFVKFWDFTDWIHRTRLTLCEPMDEKEKWNEKSNRFASNKILISRIELFTTRKLPSILRLRNLGSRGSWSCWLMTEQM